MDTLLLTEVLNQALALAPLWVGIAVSVIGWLCIAMTIVDLLVPDTIDKNFSHFMYKLPVIGWFLKFLMRFSLRRAGLPPNALDPIIDKEVDENKES